MARVALHTESAGPPGAPVLFLLHAIGTASRMWDPQVEPLSVDRRVVRVDLRGHGGSPVPRGPYRLDDLVDDVVAVIDGFDGLDGPGGADARRGSVCGLSLGAMVALRLAARHPERVDRVIALSVIPKPASGAAWLDRAAAVRRGGTAAIAELVAERWGYQDREPETAALVEDMLRATPPEGYAGCCEAIAALDLGPDLARVTAPTLLLAGSADPSAPPAIAVEMARSLPDGRVAVIDGAAHLANVDRPSAVTDAILDHLRR